MQSRHMCSIGFQTNNAEKMLPRTSHFQPVTAYVQNVILETDASSWPYAETHADAIQACWVHRQAGNPHLFNGTVFVTHHTVLSATTLSGRCFKTDFASYLHWRDNEFETLSFFDAFVCALVIGPNQTVLTGRAAPGSLNDGFRVVPGGMIDRQDVGSDRRIDVTQAALRELREETGLDETVLTRVDAGFHIAWCGPLIAIGVHYRTELSEPELLARVAHHLAAQSPPELFDPQATSLYNPNYRDPMPRYVDVLLASVRAERHVRER